MTYILPNGLSVEVNEESRENFQLVIKNIYWVLYINMLDGLIINSGIVTNEGSFDMLSHVQIDVDFFNTLIDFSRRLSSCDTQKNADEVIEIEYTDLKGDFDKFLARINEMFN